MPVWKRLVFISRAAVWSSAGALLVLSKAGCGSDFEGEVAGGARPMPACPYEGETQLLNLEAFPECPVTACPGIPTGNRAAHCLPGAAMYALDVDPGLFDQLGVCEDGGRCVPDLFAGYMLTKLPKTCRSLRGPDGEQVEGRCMSKCLKQVHDMQDMLPKTSNGECDDATELCAPCFDPRDGSPLPTCTLGHLPEGGTCDQPKEPPVQWDKCCNGGGTCLPEEVIPPEKATALGQQECPATYKCTPQIAVDDPDWSPRECRTDGGPLGITFSKEGRCVPLCAIDTTGIAGALKSLALNRGVDEGGFTKCAEDERCAPCQNLGSDTGACY